MPGPKFLKQVSGALTEEATVQTGGGGNANKIPALDANGKLDLTMMPTGVMDEVEAIAASENLSAGDFVNLWSDSGTRKVRKADSTSNKPADGFVRAAVTSGADAEVYFEGLNDQCTGLTIVDGNHFLGAAGAATHTAPSTSGHISQVLGKAISATAIQFEPQPPITLA